MDKNTQIAIFRGKGIRKIIYQNEWWFSVVDVCFALTNSPDAGAYWRKLKQRLAQESNQVVTFCHGLKLEASDGKKYLTDCANTETMFRIVQSIPSPKVEPIKRWLAKVGYPNVIPANAGILDSRFHGNDEGEAGNDNKAGILKLCRNISSIFWPVKKMAFCMLA